MPAPLGHPHGPGGLLSLGLRKRYRKDPAAFLLDTAREFGDVSSFRFGFRRVFLVNRPDLIEEVLVHSHRYFDRPPEPRPEPVDIEAALRAVKAWPAGTPFDLGAALDRDLAAILPKQEQPILEGIPAENAASSAALLSTAATWTLFLLARHGGPVPLPQAIAESLRLYPPVWAIARRVRSQFRLFNYLLHAGSVCVLSPYVTHRHPRFWPDAETFDPKRFDDGTERPRFARFPLFPDELTGPLETLLAGILDRWTLSLEPGQSITPWGGDLLRSHQPIRILATPC